MIKSFRHKGLADLFFTGSTAGINAAHAELLSAQLTFLNNMQSENIILTRRMWRPHKLQGKNPHGQTLKGHWSLKVSGNWRLTYCFTEDGNVELLDYLDYH